MSIYSYSRLSCFENCPRQYAYRYLEKPPVPRFEGIEAFVGKVVHAVLERLYKQLRLTKFNSLDDSLAYYEQEWDRRWSEDIRIVKKEYQADHYREMGRACIRNYYHRYSPFDQDQTLGLEKRVGFRLDDEGRYRLQGYIDRLAREADGRYAIHDYKTSAADPPTQEQVDQDRQLALYQLALPGLYPDAERVRLVWHYLVTDTECVSEWTPEQLEQLRRETIERIRRVETEEEFAPQESALCNWCEYYSLCPAKRHQLDIEQEAPGQEPCDDGAALVDRWAELQTEKEKLESPTKARLQEIEDELKEVKSALVTFAKANGLAYVYGGTHRAQVKQSPKITYLLEGDEEREPLKVVLMREGKWVEVSKLDENLLTDILASGQWPTEFVHLIREYQQKEDQARVYLSKRKDL